jgi:hypothetical protein
MSYFIDDMDFDRVEYTLLAQAIIQLFEIQHWFDWES